MSLRARLTAYYTLFFTLALLILGVGLYLLVRQQLLQSESEEVRIGSTLVQQAIAIDRDELLIPGRINIEREDLRPPDLSNIETPELYVQLITANGQLLTRSSTLGTQALPLTASTRQQALTGKSVQTIQQVGNTRVLELVEPLIVNGQTIGVVQVAQSLREVDRSLTVLLWTLLLGGLIALLAAARGSLWLSRTALQPIDEVSATAARILRAADLHQRVPDVSTNDEVGRLTQTINAMLQRMDQMFTVQQRFTTDVAHELRTPLAAMRGNLEILRRGALRDPTMFEESLHDIESEVQRLTRMANDLLLLAQADAGVPLRMSAVQLDEIMVEVYRDLRPLADGTHLLIELDDQVALHGDRDRLKQALINLVANALQHTPAGGSVTLGLRKEGDRARLIVTDTGSGIPIEQQGSLFERFFRGDQSRSTGGAGLGLSIVKWVVEAHGGHISVQSAPGAGATFTIELPLNADATLHEITDQGPAVRASQRHVDRAGASAGAATRTGPAR